MEQRDVGRTGRGVREERRTEQEEGEEVRRKDEWNKRVKGGQEGEDRRQERRTKQEKSEVMLRQERSRRGGGVRQMRGREWRSTRTRKRGREVECITEMKRNKA